jgi:hypothetical protein
MEAEANRLAEAAKTAPEDQKAAADQGAIAAMTQLKAAVAAVTAATERLKKATEVAAPNDLVDIVVSEPIAIRVKAMENK